MSMNLTGININNSYLIREKIAEDRTGGIWLCNSIFSAKKFIIKFIKKSCFGSNENLMSFRKEYLNTKKTNNEKIINFLEIDEYSIYVFISVEVPEGDSISSYFRKNSKFNIENIKLLFNEIINLYVNSLKFFLPAEDLKFHDFWLIINSEKIQKIKFLNFQNDIIRKYITKKNKIEKDITKQDDNEVVLIGKLFYQIFTSDIYFRKLESFIFLFKDNLKLKKRNRKMKIMRIIINAIEGKYKTFDEILKELSKLTVKREKIKTPAVEAVKYRDIFEERRRYFEQLEKERLSRIEANASISNSNKMKSAEPLKKAEKLEIYNKKIFDERRNYFENNERERWDYLRKSSEVSAKHIDNLVSQSKIYYNNTVMNTLESENAARITARYVEQISIQTKHHLDELKNDSKKYLKKINKKIDINKEKDVKYFSNRISEAENNFNDLAESSRDYFINVTNEAKTKLINENKFDKNSVKDIEKVDNIINKTTYYYKKVLTVPESYIRVKLKKANKIRHSRNKRSAEHIKNKRSFLYRIIKILICKIIRFIKHSIPAGSKTA